MGVSNGGEEWLVIFKDLFPRGRPQPEKRLPPVLLLWTQDTKGELRVVSLALKRFRYLRENKSFLCCCFSMPLPLSIWPISYSLFCVVECDRWRSLWAVQLHGAQQTEERLWRTGPNPTWGVQEAWGHPDPLCLLSPCFSCGTCVRDCSVSPPRGSEPTWQKKGGWIRLCNIKASRSCLSSLPWSDWFPLKLALNFAMLLPA